MNAVMTPLGLRPSESHRAFHVALVVSLLAHGALLFLIPGLREAAKRPEPPGPIVARLAQPVAPPAAAPAPASPVEPKPAPPKEPPPVAKPPPVQKPSPVAKPVAPAPVPAQQPSPVAPPVQAAPTPPPAQPAAQAPAAPTPAPAAPAVPAKPEAPPLATAPSAPESTDAGSLAQYRLQLVVAAKRYKRYPRVAMDNNWEGTAEVAMVIGANGMITSVTVRTSSGHEILDQQALEMFRRAKPLVPIPPALRGKEFTVTLRAIYSLKEPDA